MFDILKALRLTAVWERVSAELQKTWVDKSRQGLVEGVSVDESRKQLKVNCVPSESGEVIPVVRLDQKPDWFRISVSCPVTMRTCAVTNDGKVLSPVVKDGKDEKQFKLLFFRNATVVRFSHGEISADYLGVRAEGGKYFLVRTPRLSLEIPRFVQNKEELREFLAGKVPADLEETVAEIVSYQTEALVNPNWVKGLEDAKSTKQELVPPAEDKPRVEEKREHREKEDKPRDKKPSPKEKHNHLGKLRGASSGEIREIGVDN